MKKVWHGSRPSRRNYGNPLFARSKQRRAGFSEIVGRIKKVLVVTTIAAIVGGTAWYFVWSPAFRIDSIFIVGATPTTEQALRPIINDRISKNTWLIIPEGNIFFFDEAAAIGAMSEKFYFESVQIRKKLPHAITIEIKEKEARSVLATGNRFLAVDGSGFVVRDLTEKEIMQLADLPPDYSAIQVQGLGAETMEVNDPGTNAIPKKGASVVPVRKNRNPLPLIVEPGEPAEDAEVPRPGNAAVSPNTLALILEAYTRLPDIAGVGVRWFDPDEEAEAVRVTMTGEGGGDWLVYFSTTVPFEVQAQRLLLVLKEKIGARKNELEYVDLRYNERIFFRFRNSPPAK